MFDYLIVGAGLFGAVFAQKMVEAGKSVLMIDQRAHIGGNVYSEKKDDIQVHLYGAHIFHTSNEAVWAYVNRFVRFNHYVNRPKVVYRNTLYSFPINLLTLYQVWGVKTPQEAREKLAQVRVPIEHPSNLEAWILSQVGPELYEIFVKGYTTKQWGRPPAELPSFIIRRLPIRLNFDDNYFNDTYQGIPIGGYTGLIDQLLKGVEVRLRVNYFDDKSFWDTQAKTVVFTGKIDEYYGYRFGELAYRSLRFEHETLPMPDFQGNAVMNYTEANIPYTRILEHKHFEFGTQSHTVITREYPEEWRREKIPYYPVNDEKTTHLYHQYQALTERESGVIFGGRLAEYKYYDMHQVIASSLSAADKALKKCP